MSQQNKNYFENIAKKFDEKFSNANDHFILNYVGENSDFCRFNHGKIRQIGKVLDHNIKLRLIQNGKRQASVNIRWTGYSEKEDFLRLKDAGEYLKKIIQDLPEDPYCPKKSLDVTKVHWNESQLPPLEIMVNDIVESSQKLDVVGILANGDLYRGFFQSGGLCHWYENSLFSFDWTVYSHGDKAVKCQYADTKWNKEILIRKLDEAKVQLEVLKKSAQKVARGNYRTYLGPRAVREIMGLLTWGGFGYQGKMNGQTPFRLLSEGKSCFSPQMDITLNAQEGPIAAFDADGFTKPEKVKFIQQGKMESFLISSRSANEYKVQGNGGNEEESPEYISMQGGKLDERDILTKLHEGLYLQDLWYLNYSDRTSGKITGMTRFAGFWVEGGKISSPIDVMRFDDSIYRIFGSELEGITETPELLPNTATYDGRETGGYKLPGILLKEFSLTL